MKKRILIWSCALLVIISSYFAWAETITLTTYYPAPYGVYNDMVVMNSLGIGTTSPSEMLHLHPTTDNTPARLKLQGRGTDPGVFTLTANDNYDIAGLEYTGAMDIGWSAPGDVRLFRGATSGENRFLSVYGYDTGAGATKYGRMKVNSAGDLEFEAQSGEVIGFRTGGSRRITVDNAGNVGIGTTSPGTSKLYVSTGTANEDNIVTIESDTDNNDEGSNPRIVFRQDGGAVIGRIGYTSINILEFISQYNAPLQLGTSNSPRLTILGGGNVGIGTTGPGYKLDVKGNIVNSVPSQGYLGLTGDLPGYAVNTYPTLKTNFSNMYFSAGGAYSAYMNSAGTWTAKSDRAKKENFVELDQQEILAKIDQLPMYQWNFKAEDPSIKHIAPVAQDFHALFGLNGNDDKMISNIDPSGVALVGIKALSQKVETQQQEITQLKVEIKALKLKLNIGQ